MASVNEIIEEPREGGGDSESGLETGGDPVNRKGTKRRRSRKRLNPDGSQASIQGVPSGQNREERQKGGRHNGGQRVDGRKLEDLPPTQEDRFQFYEHYRKEAEEYDKEFMKKYDEDLNTTLIFAGLFSAVTAAFVLDVQSQLQADTGEETVALLRVLIYKIDNTTFGSDTPALPQWTGPPHAIVQVQAILYASLAASLLSAFLAMLGKQWLNQYASTDMRGTAIQRSQNRQRKLDGIVTWYFDHVMESLPLMLQIALLLLGCALSRYLWEIDTVVASVVLIVTSFGVVFYAFVVVASTASESCPYKTPGAHILRHILRIVASSRCYCLPIRWWSSFDRERPLYSTRNIRIFSYFLPTMLLAVTKDVYHLGRAILRLGVTLGKMVHRWVVGSYPQTLTSDQQTIGLGLRCVSWMLRTSLDKAVHLSALKHLATTMILADLNPTIVTDCLNVFVGCIGIRGHETVITHGSEQIATVSAVCLVRALRRISATDPKSSVLEDVRRRFEPFSFTTPGRVDPRFYFMPNVRGLPLYYAVVRMYDYFACRGPNVPLVDFEPFTQGHVPAARDMAEAARLEYQQTEPRKLPCWILRFALHSLSLNPLPPTSVIADCLSIIATDLGCDVSDAGFTTSDESARVEHGSGLITQKLKTMAENEDYRPLRSKRKAITAILPYAVWREQDGQPEMFDIILCAVRTSRMSEFMWRYVGQSVRTLFSIASPRAIVLASPHIARIRFEYSEDLALRWVVAASAVRYTEEIAQSVVDTLLQIASYDGPLGYIIADVWTWLAKRPSLPPVCLGRDVGTYAHVVNEVRALKDDEVLKSYLLLVWSEWNGVLSRDPYYTSGEVHDTAFDCPFSSSTSSPLPSNTYRVVSCSFCLMRVSIWEVFGSVGMGHHRADLVHRLDHVLAQLDRGLEYFKQHNPETNADDLHRRKDQYRILRETLLETNMEAISRSHTTFTCALPLPCL